MKSRILLIFLSLSLFACNNQVKRLDPFRWEAVDPEFDAITLDLETAFQNYVPIDSLRDRVIRLDQLATACDSDDIRGVRSRYWKARLLWRGGDRDSALTEISYAMPLVDTARYTYDFFRVRSLWRSLSRAKGARSYLDMEEEMKFYISIGDAPMTAVSYINLGTLLYPIGELDKSLEYMYKADKINHSLGFDKMVAKNAINIANIQFRRGNDAEGESILLGLLDKKEVIDDRSAYNLVLRNLYVHTNDVKWLYKAYDGVVGREDSRDLQGMYEAFLSRYYEEIGCPDSADMYSRRAMSHADDLNEHGHKALIMQAYSATMEREGKVDSALVYYKKYMDYSDSDWAQNQQAEVLRMANMREVSLAMLRETERVQKAWLYFMVALFLVILGAGVIYFMLYRRQKRYQIASRDSRLAMEKNRRHLLAVMLSVEEKNNLFNALREEIDGMRKEGTIGISEAARLENRIKMHLAGGEEWDTFQQLFVEVNPDFVSRLHDAYPTLPDSYVRLATYIYMGLDNHKISRLLVIRPESVKQARWRLRRMMGLGKDVSLDEAIRQLGV